MKQDDSWEAISKLFGQGDPSLKKQPPNDPPMPVIKPPVKRRHDQWRVRNYLLSWRLARDMSQAALAKKVGVSRQTINSIEKRHHEPVVSLALAIAEALEVKVEDVFQLQRPTFNSFDKRR